MPQRPAPTCRRCHAARVLAVAALTAATLAVAVEGRSSPIAARPQADTPMRLTPVDQLGGAASALAAGRIVIAGIGPRVVTVDPEIGIVGRTDVLNGIVRDVALDDDRAVAYAVLADGDEAGDRGGIVIIDIAEPRHPKLLGAVEADAGYVAVATVPGFVLAAGSWGWQATANIRRGVVDVYDARLAGSPTRIARLTFEHAVDDVAIVGDVAYAIHRRFRDAEATAIRSIDIGRPANPVRRAATTVPGAPSRIAAAGDGRLWVTSGPSGLRALRDAPDGSFASVGRLFADGCADDVGLDAGGTRLAVIDRCAGELRLYSAAGWPVLLDRAPVASTSAAVAWSGDRIVVAGGAAGGLATFAADGDGLRRVRDDTGVGALHALAVVPRGLVGVGPDRLTTLAWPAGVLSAVELSGGVDIAGAHGLAVSGGRAYVATGERRRVAVADIGDLDAPRAVPEADVVLPGPAQAIVADNGDPATVVVATSTDAGPRIAVLSAASGAPRAVGTIDGVFADVLALRGPRLFVGSGNGLRAFDIADPSAPRALGSPGGIGFPGDSPFALVTDARRAYATHGMDFFACPTFAPCSGLATYDVSDPALPRKVADFFLGGDESPTGLAVADEKLFVGGSEALRVFDADAIDEHIRVLAEASSPGTVRSIVVRPLDAQRALVVAADGDGGLAVYRLEPATDPTSQPTPSATDRLIGTAPPITPGPSRTASPPPPRRTLAGPVHRVYLPAAHRPGSPAGAAPPFSTPPPSLVLADVLGGPSRAAAWHGRYLYRAQAGRVLVVDATALELPVAVGRTELLPGLIFDLRVAGERLFVAAGDAGLAAYDITAPSSPALTDRIPTGDAAYGVAASPEGLVAVAAGDAGLRLFEVGPQGRLVARGRLEFPNRAMGVRLYRGHAYVIFADGSLPIQVVDVRDPTAPVLVAALDHENGASAGFHIGFAGDRAYVATCYNCLEIYEIAAPDAPRLTAAMFDVTPHALAVADGRLYTAGDSGLSVYDLASPDEPVEVGSVPLDRPTRELVVDGGRVAVVTSDGTSNEEDFGFDNGGGLVLFDARVAAQPRRAVALPSSFDAGMLLPTGRPDRLYLRTTEVVSGDSGHGDAGAQFTTSTKMHVLDVADPRRLRLAEPVPILDRVEALVVEDRTGYAIMSEGTTAASLVVLDLADVAAPQRRGAVAIDLGWSAVAVSGGVAYAATSVNREGVWSSTFMTIDVSDPDTPRVLGRLAFDGPLSSLAVAGHLLWARSFGAVARFDVGDPTRPRLERRLVLPFSSVYGADFVADERGAWVATSAGLIRIPADATDAAQATVAAPGAYVSLATDGKDRLVAAGNGVAVFDIHADRVALLYAFDAPAYKPVDPFQVFTALPVADHIVAAFAPSHSSSAMALAALVPEAPSR